MVWKKERSLMTPRTHVKSLAIKNTIIHFGCHIGLVTIQLRFFSNVFCSASYLTTKTDVRPARKLCTAELWNITDDGNLADPIVFADPFEFEEGTIPMAIPLPNSFKIFSETR